ncbi:MAG TPA: DNRLRE domain-containing protein [Arachnia sp.]|nr:DNRLRE domain-containing protein [Arachnia sp.]HMT86032.1 DNRLRE domain-containing protein [Arachnia sp.]
MLEVNGEPFFYNGVQYRVDKNRIMFGHGDAEIVRLMQEAKNLGFTGVSSQILWSDIQPDTTVPADEAAYIAGGANAGTNYSGSLQTSFETGNPSNQSLALVKYEIPASYDLRVDAAKIRIKTATAHTTSQDFKVYAVDNDWDADEITWGTAGYTFDGTTVSKDGQALEPVGALPSWDRITSAYTYDIDVTEYVTEAVNGGERTLSFVLQDATAGAAPTMIKSPAVDPTASELHLSSKDSWNFDHLDTVVDAARQAGVKFEIVWFGADSTGITTDDRTPHYALALYQKSLKAGGLPYFVKNTDPRYGPYRYLLDKADKNLQAQESHVLAEVFDHLATSDPDYTVVGVQTTNEPQIIQLNGSGQGVTHSQSEVSIERYQAERAQAVADGTFTTETAFADEFRSRLMWEYNNELSKAVKQSAHPVWTRINQHLYNDAKGTLAYNEYKRANGGTYLDFIGVDPYRIATGDVYRLGHAPYYDTSRTAVAVPNFAQGENLVMSMENGGDYPNVGDLIVATIAGGAFNKTYDLCGADGHSVLNDSVNSAYDGVCSAAGQKAANGSGNPSDYTTGQNYAAYPYATKIESLTNTNKTLQKVGYDLASKQSDGAGGTKLKFFNQTRDSGNQPLSVGTQVTKPIRSVNVTYTVDASQGTGIAIERAADEIALVNVGSQATTFTLSGLAGQVASVESGSYDRFATAATENEWVADSSQAGVSHVAQGNDLRVTVPAYTAVRVKTTSEIPAASSYIFEGEGLVFNGMGTGPYQLSTKDDQFFRDGAHGGFWLRVNSVDVGDTYTFTIPVPEGVTQAKIATAFRGAASGRGSAQLSVNGVNYGAPINQVRPATGWYVEAPDEVIALVPGAKNTFTYTATAGSSTVLSFDYIEITPVAAPAPELDVDVSVVSRCVVGKVVLAATVANNNDVPITTQLESGFGAKTVTVAPQAKTSHAFTTRAVTIEDGQLTVRTSATIDGLPVEVDGEAGYTSRAC